MVRVILEEQVAVYATKTVRKRKITVDLNDQQ